MRSPLGTRCVKFMSFVVISALATYLILHTIHGDIKGGGLLTGSESSLDELSTRGYSLTPGRVSSTKEHASDHKIVLSRDHNETLEIADSQNSTSDKTNNQGAASLASFRNFTVYTLSTTAYPTLKTPEHSNTSATTNGSYFEEPVASSSSKNDTEGMVLETQEPCFKSPYILCDQDLSKPNYNRTIKIAYLRRPHWQPISEFNFSKCRVSNCLFQDDRLTPDTDLVLVFGGGLQDSERPPRLMPHQLCALTNWEPPDRIEASFVYDENSVWNHVFNLTITYRLDSDIPVSYSRLKPNPKSRDERPNYYEIAKQKNKTALWFVTRCNVPSKRLDYVREMQKYIDVDIYGHCGKPCTIKSEYCIKNFNQYKFYLSFENSFCKDYVTEKLFRNFAPGRYVIPVVRGGGSYDKYFPRGLFINSANFKTPKSLALYLKDLGSDPVRYSQELALKDSYVLGEDTLLQEFGFEICKSLNEGHLQPKTYDMKKWFHEGRCKKGSEIIWPDE